MDNNKIASDLIEVARVVASLNKDVDADVDAIHGLMEDRNYILIYDTVHKKYSWLDGRVLRKVPVKNANIEAALEKMKKEGNLVEHDDWLAMWMWYKHKGNRKPLGRR